MPQCENHMLHKKTKVKILRVHMVADIMHVSCTEDDRRFQLHEHRNVQCAPLGVLASIVCKESASENGKNAHRTFVLHTNHLAFIVIVIQLI